MAEYLRDFVEARLYAQLILDDLGEYLGYSPPPLFDRLIEDAKKIHKQRPILQETLATATESYVGDQAEFDESKNVITFEPGSLYKLAEPIEYGSRVPYSLRYTELGRFKHAETTDDIL